jgi:hypothetical protein
MPIRMVRMTVRNATSFILTKFKGDNNTLCHGSFTDPFSFPQTINAGDSATWEAESSGVATGTEGWVKYQVTGVGDIITFYWTNPFVGNTFFGFQATSVDSVDPKQRWSADCGDAVQSGGSTFQPPPSRFNFFAPKSAFLNGKLIGVIQGDVGDESALLILPFPWQDHLAVHAWFDIGIRDLTATSMRLILRTLNVGPPMSVRAIAPGIPSFSVTQRLHLPFS